MDREDEVKRLAEVKAYLERRITEHAKELEGLKLLVECVDKILTEKSFRRVETPVKPGVPLRERGEAAKPVRKLPLKTPKGLRLADLLVEGNSFRVLPVADLSLDVGLPPLESFLVNRVLKPMRKKSAESTGMSGEPAFSYQIKEEGGRLSEIVVKNYGGERRLTELRSAIQWTLRRMYEKAKGGVNTPNSRRPWGMKGELTL